MKTVKILVVDDNVKLLSDVSQFCKNMGETVLVTTVSTVQKAQEILGKEDFDILFVDGYITGGTGLDVIASIRSIPHIFFHSKDENLLRRAQKFVDANSIKAQILNKKNLDQQMYLLKERIVNLLKYKPEFVPG